MGKIQNRPEIDGLRAVAVVPVVLFHAAMGFDGGYVGVDVFFVISGYLITSLILSDLNLGTFSIANFWERRIRRIMPAAVVMIVSTLVAGWLILLPADFDQLGMSIVAQALLSANIFFWQTTGYFSAESFQPLLHTWSLAVEEQFYLFFPFFLLALHRFNKRWLVWGIGVGTVVSFALNLYLTKRFPMAAFYLLPGRAWELGLGALLAALPASRTSVKWLNELVSVGGLAAIAVAVLFYTRETPFPGIAAALPCVGAAAIIWSNSSSQTLVGRMLSVRPIVVVGLVSYSFYLWHWPILVLANYWAAEGLNLGARLTAALASFALALLSWKFVESPFRRRTNRSSRSVVFACAAGASAGVIVAGFSIHQLRGVMTRWPETALRYFENREDKVIRREADLASARKGTLPELGVKGGTGPIRLLVWGDSHARTVLPALDAICTEFKVRGVAAVHAATVPLLDLRNSKKFSLGDDTIPYNQAVVDFVRKKHVESVLLVARWSAYLPSEGPADEFPKALSRTISELRRAGARVFVMKDVPEHPFDVPRALALAVARARDPSTVGVPLDSHQVKTAFENRLLDALARESVVVLDPVPFFLDRNGLCRAERNGHALYVDRHHLSGFGAQQLEPLFKPIFQ